MFKRLFIVGILTGVGQLYSLWVLKQVSGSRTTDQVEGVAQADLLFFLLMNIIAMGLQPAAIRDIATSREWKAGFYDVQRARLTLSLFLFPVGLFFLYDTAYAIFFVAPLLALSGDYALYALSKPVEGAAVAFLRTVVPYSFLLAGGYWAKGAAAALFMLGIFVVYLFSDKLVAGLLHVKVMVRPRLGSLRLYLKSMLLGVVNLSLYFIGPGILLVVPFFYSTELVAISFSAVKFYFIYKGVLRIIHQSFVREMLDERVCLKVDKLSVLVALILCCAVFLFPSSFIRTFFGTYYLSFSLLFKWLSIAALLYAFALSEATRLQLYKKDVSYTVLCFSAALVSFVALFLLPDHATQGVLVAQSIVAGEAFFLIGLVYLSAVRGFVWERSRFLFVCLLVGIIPFLLNRWLGDTVFSMTIAVLVFGAGILLLYGRALLSPVLTQND